MEEEVQVGLNDTNRGMLTSMAFFIALLFGPVNPPELAVRIGYLIAIPVVVWFSLKFLGARWQLGEEDNKRVNCLLWGVLSGALLVGAYLQYSRGYYFECTQRILTRDGQECVGDYVPVEGADMVGTLMFLLAAAGAFWFGFVRQRD